MIFKANIIHSIPNPHSIYFKTVVRIYTQTQTIHPRSHNHTHRNPTKTLAENNPRHLALPSLVVSFGALLKLRTTQDTPGAPRPK